MKILVRLPNWLGDMVMAVGFINQLKRVYPAAEISVIAKKGIHELLPFFPAFKHQFIFNKSDHKGLKGLWKFGRSIRKKEKFDLFFSLPDSYSSAVIGRATGAKKRVGYKQEMRSLFLTHSYKKPEGLHRVDEYVSLLELFTDQKLQGTEVSLKNNFDTKDHIVININSEASSRRLTIPKAIEFINALNAELDLTLILVGSNKEKLFIDEIYHQLDDTSAIINRAGNTNLPQLVELMGSAAMVISTDSGPAHLANALGVYTIVLFGAGNEFNTAPYNKENLSVVRLGKLTCEPCRKNVCVRYDIPQCLEQLNSYSIANIAKTHLADAK